VIADYQPGWIGLGIGGTVLIVIATAALTIEGRRRRPASVAVRHRPRHARAPESPADQSTATPARRPRQHAAMRLTVIVLAALFLAAVISGATEIALHGYSFFVFRSAGTGATPDNGRKENQGPGQPDAPGAHHLLIRPIP
jgi:hypothetical protein